MYKNIIKIDFHNFAAKDAVTLAIWNVASKFMYEQFTSEIKCSIVEALNHAMEDLATKEVIWTFKSNCYLQADQLVLEIVFAENPSNALKPTKVEVKLNCG